MNKSRANSRNACHHTDQNIFTSNLLPNNVKIKMYTTIILSVVFYECETLSLILTAEHIMCV
jgi:hypothetical protein